MKSVREKPAVNRVITFYNDRALYYAIPRAMVMIYFFNLYVRSNGQKLEGIRIAASLHLQPE